MVNQSRSRAVRSDSLRNREAILHAAAACLTDNPAASLAEIAEAAGVARITLYGHFSSRTELLTALVDDAMARVEGELSSVDLSGDVWNAFAALVETSWRLVSSLSVLRGLAEHDLPAEVLHGSHRDPRARVESLLARGRSAGEIRDDQTIAWQVACYFSLLHGAATEVRAGRLAEADVATFLLPTLRSVLERR